MTGQIKRYMHVSFLLTLLAAHMICVFCFTHVHVVNGVRIVHSHPYSESSGHQHTTQEFVLLAGISHLNALPSPSSVFEFRDYSTTVYIYINYRIGDKQMAPVPLYFLRAPPAFNTFFI